MCLVVDAARAAADGQAALALELAAANGTSALVAAAALLLLLAGAGEVADIILVQRCADTCGHDVHSAHSIPSFGDSANAPHGAML